MRPPPPRRSSRAAEAPIPESWLTLVVAVLGSTALVALVTILAWPWRVEGTLKATTHDAVVSLAGGLEMAHVSGSAAAILGGPGVIAVHLRARELWRRPIAQVSLDALLAWLDAPPAPAKKPSTLGRLAKRAKDALLARTDLAELPALGLRVFLDLRDLALRGNVHCGFSDAAITGKAAAWLYPTAAALAPFGTVDVSFDWSGRNVLDGAFEISFRVVPARVALEGLRFARHHVHLTPEKRAHGFPEQADRTDDEDHERRPYAARRAPLDVEERDAHR